MKRFKNPLLILGISTVVFLLTITTFSHVMAENEPELVTVHATYRKGRGIGCKEFSSWPSCEKFCTNLPSRCLCDLGKCPD